MAPRNGLVIGYTHVDCAQWDRAPHEVGISRQEVNGDLAAAVAADDDGGGGAQRLEQRGRGVGVLSNGGRIVEVRSPRAQPRRPYPLGPLVLRRLARAGAAADRLRRRARVREPRVASVRRPA